MSFLFFGFCRQKRAADSVCQAGLSLIPCVTSSLYLRNSHGDRGWMPDISARGKEATYWSSTAERNM